MVFAELCYVIMPTEANGRAQQLLPALEINVQALPCLVNCATKRAANNEDFFEKPGFCYLEGNEINVEALQG